MRPNWVNALVMLLVGVVLVVCAGLLPGLLATLCYIVGIVLVVVGLVLLIVGLVRGGV